MKPGGILALALGLAGAGALAWGAVVWTRENRAVETWSTRRAEREAELKTTLAELHQVSVRYRALQKSIPNVPDSLRAEMGAAFNQENKYYSARVHKLEYAERDIRLKITDAKRRESRALAQRKASTLPFFAGGAGACVCAALLAVVTRPRRDAA